jgi:hypothetical protein
MNMGITTSKAREYIFMLKDFGKFDMKEGMLINANR